MTQQEVRYSVNPAGEKFEIPKQEAYAEEFERLKSLVDIARGEGKEIVVVMGVGFVGAVMAAIVANTTDENGNYTKFVSGAIGRVPCSTGESHR